MNIIIRNNDYNSDDEEEEEVYVKAIAHRLYM